MTDYAPGTSLYSRHINQYLTGYWQGWAGNDFISNFIAPRVQVQKMSDLFKVWGREHMKYVETRRADKAESKTVAFGWSDDTYKLHFEALNFEVSQAERENADDQLSPEFRGVDRLGQLIDLSREKRVATLVEATASVVAANRNVIGTTAGFSTTVWSDYDGYAQGTNHPLTDIRLMKRQIYSGTLMQANALIIPTTAAETLANHPEYLERYKNTDTSLITDGGLLPIIQNLWVIEATAIEDTAKDGQSVTMGNVWDATKVHVAYIDGLPPVAKGKLLVGSNRPVSFGDNMTWIRTFEKSGSRVVRQWNWMNKRNLDVFEVEETLGEQVTSTLLASRLSGVA